MGQVQVATTNRFDRSTDRAYRMLIDGAWVDGSSGETFRCVDPFTGKPWGHIPVASAADVNTAVVAARKAFDEGGWPNTAPAKRAALLRKLASLIDESAEELARAQIHENGKLISEMLPGAHALADTCYYFAGLAESTHGQSVISSVSGSPVTPVTSPSGW